MAISIMTLRGPATSRLTHTHKNSNNRNDTPEWYT